VGALISIRIAFKNWEMALRSTMYIAGFAALQQRIWYIFLINVGMIMQRVKSITNSLYWEAKAH
jgi:hypothetical protein